MKFQDNQKRPDFISRQVMRGDYFVLDLNPSALKPFTVVCGGLEHCSLDYKIERQTFKYYGMEYIANGSCRLILEEREYQLKAGSIFCYGPRTQHHIENSGCVPLVKFFVDFIGSDIREVLGDSFYNPRRPFQMSTLRRMHELFTLVLEIGKDGGRNVQKSLKLILNLISLQVMDNSVHLDEFSSLSHTTYERCQAYMENNYPSITSISQMASSCNVSTGYMARVFMKYAKESPSNALVRMKLNKAGELLLSSQLLVKEVADRVGYKDPYHFSRLFKKFFGLSPQQFRDSLDRG